MIENIINQSLNSFLTLTKLTPFEVCILKKASYGYKLSKKEKISYLYLYEFKYKPIKIMRSLINERTKKSKN